MAREGDRLTVRTDHGDARIERTQQGVTVQMPSPQAQLSPGQARQLSQAIRALSEGGGQPQQGGSQQSQQFQQGSSGQQGWSRS